MAAEYEIVDPNLPKPPAPATSYLTTDHLGSLRVVTDENGEVVSRRDFMPFGEEIYVGVGDRTTNLKYSLSTVDHIRQRFTGYEKDNESDLDFAQARMYQNKHGRFTAPDPLMASANPANPQTFNRYIYTGNNPVNYIDPSGLCGTTPGTTDGSRCIWLMNTDGSYFSISETEYGNGANYPNATIVTDPSAVVLTNPVFHGNYAEVEKYKQIVERGMSAGLGEDGMFYGFNSDVSIFEENDDASITSRRTWVRFGSGFHGGLIHCLLEKDLNFMFLIRIIEN